MKSFIEKTLSEFDKQFSIDPARAFFGDPEKLKAEGWEVGPSELILKQVTTPAKVKDFIRTALTDFVKLAQSELERKTKPELSLRSKPHEHTGRIVFCTDCSVEQVWNKAVENTQSTLSRLLSGEVEK